MIRPFSNPDSAQNDAVLGRIVETVKIRQMVLANSLQVVHNAPIIWRQKYLIRTLVMMLKTERFLSSQVEQ